MAWLLRFVTWFVERYSQSSVHAKPQSSLERELLFTVDEVQEADRAIIKQVQRFSFPEVIQALRRISSCQYISLDI